MAITIFHPVVRLKELFAYRNSFFTVFHAWFSETVFFYWYFSGLEPASPRNINEETRGRAIVIKVIIPSTHRHQHTAYSF
ncbi:MAG: hypothetical protein ACRBBR_02815 [Cellvibrionaceae bacterium]